MKYSVLILPVVILFGIIIYAIIFRYEYFGSRHGFEIRADRWTDCIESWNVQDNAYEPLNESC